MTPITWYLYGRSGGAKKAAEEIGVKGSVSGDIASFSDGADNIPMQSVVAEITPAQSGTGDPSPTNVRPISGRTGLTVTRAGKNLLNNTLSTQTIAGITFTKNADGTLTANGTATANAQVRIVIGADDLPRGVNLYFSGCPTGGAARVYDVYIWDSTTNSRAKQWDGVTNVVSDYGTPQNKQLRLEEGHEYVYIIRIEQVGLTVNNLVFKPMIRVADSLDSEYEPYTGTTIPITWETEAGTIYGGTLDVVSGVLTVEYGAITFDGTQTLTDKISSADRAYMQVPGMAAKAMLNDPLVTCNRLPKTAAYQNASRACVCIGHDSTGNYIYLQGVSHLDGVTNLATFNAWLADNPVVCTYELATPQTYQLTPTEVRTLLGGNTIYTDAGGVTVEYIADTKLYIDNKIAELQALVLEN